MLINESLLPNCLALLGTFLITL